MIVPLENNEDETPEKASKDIENDISGIDHEETPALTRKELKEQEKEKRRLEKETKKEKKEAFAKKKLREKFKRKEVKRLENEKKLKEKEAIVAEKRKFLFTDQDKLSRLEKYDEEDQADQDNLIFIADEQFKGPTRKKKKKNYFRKN